MRALIAKLASVKEKLHEALAKIERALADDSPENASRKAKVLEHLRRTEKNL